MNWKSIKFDWNQARAFLVTAEEGSFSAAAKALNMTQPTLGRQVYALEKTLGVTLFERIGKGLEITPNGLELVEYVRAMGDAANQLSLNASGKSTIIEGNVCISATDTMAAFILPPIIQKLRKQQPGILVEIVASNTSSDLKRREADIAIRNVTPAQPDLIAKKLPDITTYLYATKQYLKQFQEIKSPADLNNADFIGFPNNRPVIETYQGIGIEVSSKNFPMITQSHLIHWQLTKAGIGIGIMLDFIGDNEPLVIRALPDQEPMVGETWLVVHSELKTNRRVRIVYDFLYKELESLFLDAQPRPDHYRL